jgi:hypothetical protein
VLLVLPLQASLHLPLVLPLQPSPQPLQPQLSLQPPLSLHPQWLAVSRD